MIEFVLLPVEDWYVLEVKTNQKAELQNWGVPNAPNHGGVEFSIYKVTEQDLTTAGVGLLRMVYQMEKARKALDKPSKT